MPDFYRKEKLDNFKKYVEKVDDEYKLKTGTIYQAKIKPVGKNITLIQTIKGSKLTNKVKVNCTVSFSGNNLVIKVSATKSYTILESQCAAILALKDTTAIKYLALNKLCKDHATSSSNSPLISGCVNIDALNQGKIYPGYKFQLDLKIRTPFKNPHSSGLEAEHFLIGKVLGSDCNTVTYIGLIKLVEKKPVEFARGNLVTI